MGALPEPEPLPGPPRRRRARRYHRSLPPAPGQCGVNAPLIQQPSTIRAQRLGASLALMLGPGLALHLLLSPWRSPSPESLQTSLLALEHEHGELARWLEAADRGRSQEWLHRRLQQREQALNGISSVACGLLLKAELQHVQGRLEEQLPGQQQRDAWPSWQRRFGPQLTAAQANLEQCRAASDRARG